MRRVASWKVCSSWASFCLSLARPSKLDQSSKSAVLQSSTKVYWFPWSVWNHRRNLLPISSRWLMTSNGTEASAVSWHSSSSYSSTTMNLFHDQSMRWRCFRDLEDLQDRTQILALLYWRSRRFRWSRCLALWNLMAMNSSKIDSEHHYMRCDWLFDLKAFPWH